MNQVLERNSQVNHLMMQQLAPQMENLKDDSKYNIKNYSYAYIVMKALNDKGLVQEANLIKEIAQIQKDLDAIMNDLNQLKQLLQQMQNQGWGFEDDGKTNWDPAKHTDEENTHHMIKIMNAWLNQTSNITGPDGKTITVTNRQKMINIWSDLFTDQYKKDKDGNIIKDKDGNPIIDKLSLAHQLQVDLKKGKQFDSAQSVLDILNGLNGTSFSGADSDWTGTYIDKDGNQQSFTFLQFLQGFNGTGQYQDVGVAFLFACAFTHSWYSRTGQNPKADPNHPTVNKNDCIKDVDDKFETSKQSLNGLNTTESSNLSMDSQNLTSLIQIGQQITQSYGQETKTYVGNFPGRG